MHVILQENQQCNTFYKKYQDFVDRTRDKLNESLEISSTLPEINKKSQTVKGIRESLEQEQNKLK